MAAACAGSTMLRNGWTVFAVDYTLKLLSPTDGEKLISRGRVLRPGRTLSVAAADVFSVRDGKKTLCAIALTTVRNCCAALKVDINAEALFKGRTVGAIVEGLLQAGSDQSRRFQARTRDEIEHGRR
jgi:hypothetical protein